MFFPYKDINPTRRTPVITYLLLLGNIGVYLYMVYGARGFLYYSHQLAFIPIELFRGNMPSSTDIPPLVSLVTYMFTHGDFTHLLFNMLFLWIFGNNVEDVMNRVRFPFFYLVCGIASALAFVVLDPLSVSLLVGASGAISGVLGAYLFLFPMAKVHAIVVIIPVRMPAIVFIMIWFFFQISGIVGGGGGNIAWISHLAGFLVGAFIYPLFLDKSYHR